MEIVKINDGEWEYVNMGAPGPGALAKYGRSCSECLFFTDLIYPAMQYVYSRLNTKRILSLIPALLQVVILVLSSKKSNSC